MDEDFKNQLIDYFDSFELVELLGITTEEVVMAFEEQIEDNLEKLKDFMNYGE